MGVYETTILRPLHKLIKVFASFLCVWHLHVGMLIRRQY